MTDERWGGAIPPWVERHESSAIGDDAVRFGRPGSFESRGHASITSTQIYVHPSAERQREAVDRLAGTLRGRPGSGAPR